MRIEILKSTPLLLTLLLPPSSAAQQAPLNGQEAALAAPAGRPNVFFDCNGPGCDQNYYRTEIAWVNWVRQPEDSHVHVIITSQATGAGGREYLLDFTGREPHADYRDQVTYRSAQSDTERESLDGMAHTLALGLARFADVTGYKGLVQLSTTAAPAGGGRGAGARNVVSAEQVSDPWNLWTFRIGGNANLNGQETQSNAMISGNLNASRVTPQWRVSYGGNVNYNRQRRELTDTTIIDPRLNFGINTLMVNSLAGHWSGGFSVNVSRMEMQNQRLQVAIQPALEYSYFPYEEATRRSLTALYEVGPQYRNYFEETLFGLMEETQVEHSLSIDFNQRQTWGDAGITITAQQFLRDMEKYRVGVNGNLSFRIFRGMNINLNGNYAKVQNQIYLSAGGVTDTEILLNRRAQASSFNYGMMVGLSYQFGSIFNNVVNNRFSGQGGGPGGRGGGPGGGGGPGPGGRG
jgi:hypothetical protein